MPANMSGSAVGKAIFHTTASRDTEARAPLRSTAARHAAKPCTVASSIGQTEPKAITPTAICGVRPKIAMATGITAEAGSGRRIRASARQGARRAEEPISAPSPTPDRRGQRQPSAICASVPASSASSSPRAMPSTNAVQARSGPGRNSGGTELQRRDRRPERDEQPRARRGWRGQASFFTAPLSAREQDAPRRTAAPR